MTRQQVLPAREVVAMTDRRSYRRPRSFRDRLPLYAVLGAVVVFWVVVARALWVVVT